MGDVTETATSRTVREDLEAALPPSVTAADLGDCGSRASVLDRIVRQWNRTEARAAAKLTHTHAVVRRKVGESVAHLAVPCHRCRRVRVPTSATRASTVIAAASR